MRKVVLIHFMPLEFYPPVTNAIDILARENSLKLSVCSTKNNKNRKEFVNDTVDVFRIPFPDSKSNVLGRLLRYVQFNLFTLLKLVFLKPEVVFYYESYSAWPVYIYHRYMRFFSKPDIFIHFHEYSPLVWYKTTMRQVRYYYILEKKYLWKKAKWISHTNSKRVEMFLDDHPFINKKCVYEMPNYPPESWISNPNRKTKQGGVIRLVYVGSLSFQDTYLKEICDFIKIKNGAYTLDIYSFNLHEDVRSYLNELNNSFILYHEQGIDYSDIPKVLGLYDAGLILYKGNTLNCIHSAPNKLIEYLACGLNVLYSSEMIGITEFVSKERLGEEVHKVDFNHIIIPDLSYSNKDMSFTSETALSTLINHLR